MIEQISVRIRRRETPLYRGLYRAAKQARSISVPVLGPFHRFLYHERRARLAAWQNFWRVLYDEPLFKSRCERVGRNFNLQGGIPLVMGHLRIRIGDNVRISGVTTFTAARLAEEPVLEIGDHSYVGYQVTITVGARVSIGRHVLIANRVLVAGDDGHPADPVARRTQPGRGTGTVVIEDDVWICDAAVILKGVTVGAGSIIGAGAVVTEDVPPRSLLAGNPARVVRTL